MELYLHIPFCARKCAYCDFLSFSQGPDVQKQYVERLIEEIATASAGFRDTTVTSVFVGGGTPSILESGEMVRIFEALRQNFQIAKDAEISMEANPGTVTEKKLRDYKRAGINRLSFGLQSAENHQLKALGRIHSYQEFLESYRLARACGFKNINVDLMSALPGQTVDSWIETLRKVAALEPEHISAYSLIIEEGTPFYEKYGEHRGEGFLPDEDAEREMYHKTRSVLNELGYERYEISNYAKPGYECRHNIGYWTGVSYLGLGLGASSYIKKCRFCNTSDLAEYLKEGPGRRYDEIILTEQDMQEEYFFVGLRLVRGVSLKQFEAQFGVSVHEVYPGLLEQILASGGAEMDGEYFRLTEYGMDVSSYIMAKFLQG